MAQDVPLTRGVQQVKVDFLGTFSLVFFTIGDVALPLNLSVETDASPNAPTVSTNDLAQAAYLSSSAVSNDELGSEHQQLFNGQIGTEDTDTNDAGEVRVLAGDSLTINFDTSVNTEGYDITGIDSYFGWNPANGGRSNQGYSIRFGLVDGSSVEEAAQHWNPNDPASFWTTVSFTEAAGGVIVSGVESITFEFTEPANANGALVAREIDIFGVPTGDGVAGDFNDDGKVDCADLEAYAGNIGAAATGSLADLDLDGNGTIEVADANIHITTLLETSNGQVGTFPGDLNCDGQVDVLGDASILVSNLNNAVTSYSAGDINFDGIVDVLGDAVALVENLGRSNEE